MLCVRHVVTTSGHQQCLLSACEIRAAVLFPLPLCRFCADGVVFGRYFVSNPDLPARIALDAPLNPYNRWGGETASPSLRGIFLCLLACGFDNETHNSYLPTRWSMGLYHNHY